MIIDKFGQKIFNEDDLCDVVLSDLDISNRKILVSKDINNLLDLEKFPKLTKYKETDLTVDQFDEQNQNIWFMPKSYYELDIAQYVINLCDTNEELLRVEEELLLYQKKNLFNLLQYLKYLVDTCRTHNIVWGVGRGSSVASFVLFLIGVHKINSLHYDLPINEFFKD
jgi:DNA polymerase III alpha subunit